MKKLIVLTIIFLWTVNTFAQNTVKGIVYEDANRNGKKERREKGIPQVAVSNGEQVVLTDQNGKYELPLKDDQVIFVIKPSSHELPRTSQNIPQFYYIHKPQGSPQGLQYPGVAPTGKLPKSVDFGLYPSLASNQFTALVMGDPQPYTMDDVEAFERGIIDEIAGISGITFGLALGDLVGDDLTLFEHYKNAVSRVGVPWFSLMGNHDMNYDVEKDEHSDETYTANFGPATYAFNYGDVHFVVLEDILYPDPRDGRGYWGGLRPDQLLFVENNLKLVPKDKAVVLFMHIPIFEENGDTFRDEDRQKLLELLSPFKNSMSFSAHTHYFKQTFWGSEDGFTGSKAHHHYNTGTPSGDWYSGKILPNGTPETTMRDGSPKGYLFLEFDGTEIKPKYKAAGKSADYQMEIFAPKVLAKGVRTTSGIVVNFFTGSPGDQVKYRINSGEWKSMQQIEDRDPSYILKVMEWDTTEEVMPGRRPSNPVFTDHLWRAPIPNDLEIGTHTIEVEATDAFGQKHRGTRTFRMAEPIRQ